MSKRSQHKLLHQQILVVSLPYCMHRTCRGYSPGGPGGPGGPSMIPVGNASPFSVVVNPRSPLSPLSPWNLNKKMLYIFNGYCAREETGPFEDKFQVRNLNTSHGHPSGDMCIFIHISPISLYPVRVFDMFSSWQV